MRVILKNTNLLVLALAEGVSGLGSWITMMAVITMIVFQGDGGVAETSGIMLAGLGPFLIMGPVAGSLADRFDRKRLMIVSQLLSAGAVLALMHAETLATTYVLLALASVTSSLMMPARRAAIPSLVGREQLTQANALLQQLASGIKIFAPMLAGGVLVVLEPQQAMALDVVSYCVAALVLTRLPSLVPEAQAIAVSQADESKDRRLPPPSPSVIQVVRRNPQLSLLFAMAFLAVFVIMGFDVLSSVLTRDILGGDERILGVVIGLVGVGSVAGSLMLMGKPSTDPWRDTLVGLGLLAAIPASAAAAAHVDVATTARVLTGSGALIGGFGSALINVQTTTLLQTEAPEGTLGRLSGLFQSTVVAAQLVAILTTPLYVPALLSMAGYFALSTLALGLVTGLTAWWLKGIRQRAAASGTAPGTVPGTVTADLQVDRPICEPATAA